VKEALATCHKTLKKAFEKVSGGEPNHEEAEPEVQEMTEA
jgi:hypothetical protein